jgi:tRNA A37 threonylcarbamoyladenosine synthetase subunit TsaC/SUA5/YrdC
MTDVTAAAEEAFRIIMEQDGLALVPATIGYGLLGNSRASIEKMYRIKGRVYENPCIVAATLDTLGTIMRPVPEPLHAWVAQVAALGPVAVVYQIDPESGPISRLDPWVRERCVTDDTAAVFLNTGPFVEHMLTLAQAEGVLLVGSSGNQSGQGNNYTYQDVPPELLDGVDYSVDLGPAAHLNTESLATTIVNLTNFTVRRKGVLFDQIIESYRLMAAEHPEFPADLPYTPRRPS